MLCRRIKEGAEGIVELIDRLKVIDTFVGSEENHKAMNHVIELCNRDEIMRPVWKKGSSGTQRKATLRCPVCDYAIVAYAKFCHRCGQHIDK